MNKRVENYGGQRVYFANARLMGKTALLAGPFLTAPEAEKTLDIVGPAFVQMEPRAKGATFGVMECNAPGPGAGELNHLLPNEMIASLAVPVWRN